MTASGGALSISGGRCGSQALVRLPRSRTETMAARTVFVLLLAISAHLGVVSAKNECNATLRTKISHGSVSPDGDLVAVDGTHYLKGTFWQEKRHWWACPCLSGTCIRICSKDVAKLSNATMPAEKDHRVQILDGKEEKWVLVASHFKVIRDAACADPFSLSPNDIPEDQTHLFPNGSLFYPHPSISENLRIAPVHQFCLIPQEGEKQLVIVCNDEMEAAKMITNLKFKIYPAFFILSAIFLLLTLVAFFVTPDHKNVHGRSVVCQSGSLLIFYVGMTINYLTGETNNDKVCIIVAYITYYFLMASFFWLNVMCIDIYLTFKGSMMRHHEHKVKAFSIYAWGVPLIIFIIAITIQLTTISDIYSPNIGKKRCWFQSFVSELLYYTGPVLILLISNMFLFGSTVVGLWRLKKESKKVLRGGDSRVHTRNHNEHDKDRLVLYIKLFMLMGVTWIMEVVSWAVGGPDSIWFITDTVNCLRGVLIFWFCVWSNKVMRTALKERIFPFKKSKNISLAERATTVFNISSKVDSRLHH